MRARLAIALAAVLASAAAAQPDAFVRKSGLWIVKLTVDGGAWPIPDSRLCIDAGSDARLTLVGSQMNRAHCAAYTVTPEYDLADVHVAGSDHWRINSVCALADGSTVSTYAVVTGDPQSAYAIDGVGAQAKDGAETGRHTVRIEAAYAGPCPPGMTGGDVVTGNRSYNVFAPKGTGP
jgi:hypothetical protein